MNTIWGPWGRTDDGPWSSFKQWWYCDRQGHTAGPDDERCSVCGARRSKLNVYGGIDRKPPPPIGKVG